MIRSSLPAAKELYLRTKYRFADEEVTYQVDGAIARFHAKTYPEFRRFRSLMGEEAVLADLLESLEPDDVFFDVGANVGTYACFAAGVLRDDHVIAFEPEPANAARLLKNAELNGRSVELYELALSDGEGTTYLERAGTAAGNGEHALSRTPSSDSIEVTEVRGDWLVELGEVPSPTVVKVDVEGAELQVLEGLARSIDRQGCRLVYCEVHPNRLRGYGHTVNGLNTHLENSGFVVDTLLRLEDKYFLKAEKPP